MKRFVCLLICICGIFMQTHAQIIGAAYATDICAYIDYLMVPSYNIDGYTAVVVRDLENFGYTVNWDETTKTVSFYRDFVKPLTPLVPVFENRPVGTKVFDVYQTDIRTVFKGTEIPSYNIGGRTAVRLRDLAMVGEAMFDEKYRSADVFSMEAEYFEDEIDFIKTKVYGNLRLMSEADFALQPLIAMLQNGEYDWQKVAAYQTFHNDMVNSFNAYKSFIEPYGFSETAQELWWAMVNLRYAGETALIMADTLYKGGNITQAMGYYNQYLSDSVEQRRITLLTLDEEMRALTLFWG